MFEAPGTLVVAIALLLAFLGSGTGVAFLIGRRSARVSTDDETLREQRFSGNFVRELERCLELGDYVARDADTLAALLATQRQTLDRPLASAMQQLIKTTKSLAGRLNRMEAEASIVRPCSGTRLIILPLQRAAEPAAPARQTSVPAQDEADPARHTDKFEKLPASPFEEVRQFPRGSFHGSAKATIYPRHSGPGREPIQCTVLTRDLSCGGIGIAHSDQLFPKQIVVLDAVGKLLVGEVRWCRRVDENFYVAGCRLVKTNG